MVGGRWLAALVTTLTRFKIDGGEMAGVHIPKSKFEHRHWFANSGFLRIVVS